MNYAAYAAFGYARYGIPLGHRWERVSYALAGYGPIVGGSKASDEPVVCENSVSRVCTATSSIEVV